MPVLTQRRYGLKKHVTGWIFVVPEGSPGDEAIRVAIEDLKEAAAGLGLPLEIASDATCPSGNAIILGDSTRNRQRAVLGGRGLVRLSNVGRADGYQIETMEEGGRRQVCVAGGSLLGEAYGIYRIRERLRVEGDVPVLNVVEQPDLEFRYTRIRVSSEEDIRRALRYRLNMVFGENPLNLVPWVCGSGDDENRKHRDETGKLAGYAHSLHMKFLAFGTEFTYHPALLEEFGAKPTPSDPQLWEAIRAKFRRLLDSVPELDGVCTFVGEEQSYWDPYRMLDVMHDGEGCDWSLEKRYRTFVKAVWDVVVGEFGRLFLHRTWNTNAYEQQSQPDIYARTFTDDVPTENLYLIPSFTQNDRWWFQAYNPTFNLTPHSMMAVFETMDYHDGGDFFPTFPGFYFQAGLDSILGAPKSNLKGASLDLPAREGWDTRTLTAYTVSRLMWNHREDPREIARDFCAIYFGPELAARMAEILMLSPVAYKYGLYIEPMVYGAFTSLHHIRTGHFVVEGYPSIDAGKEHIEFLRRIYLRCKPWARETLSYLDHGLETAREMEEKYAALTPHIRDEALRVKVGNSLEMTRLLIETNNLYVKTAFAYFRYREERGEKERGDLESILGRLRAIRKAFLNVPGCRFKPYGVDQLIVNAAHVLEDLDAAEKVLQEAPTTSEIERIVTEQQTRYRRTLAEHGDEVLKVLYWEGRVDGRDMLIVRGEDIRIEHLRWDPIYLQNHRFFAPLPERPGTVLIEDIESEPMHPFVLQQPKEENDFTAKIYLNDIPGGAHWFRFNIYFLDRAPSELGLDVPWDRGNGRPSSEV